jgi:hypothetical protein
MEFKVSHRIANNSARIGREKWWKARRASLATTTIGNAFYGSTGYMSRAMKTPRVMGLERTNKAEMIYLVEKARIPASAVGDLHDATANPNGVLQYVPLDEHVATKMGEIPRQDLPDLPDRVVALQHFSIKYRY